MKITESSLRQLIRTILLSENREEDKAYRKLKSAAEDYQDISSKIKKKKKEELDKIVSNPENNTEEDK